MRRVHVLIAFLIVGYMLSIWNFILTPKYIIVFGMKGLIVSLIPMALALALIYFEMESTKRTKYLMYEFFVKASRTPGVALTLLLFLTIMLSVTAYYSSFAISRAAGLGQFYIVLLAILTLLASALLLLIAKGKTLEFISAVSVLFIIFSIVTVILIRSEATAQITNKDSLLYLTQTMESLKSFDHKMTFASIVQLLLITLVGFGLGAGFYYVLGSFIPEDMDTKKVIAGVLVLQVLLSFVAALIVVYSLGFAHQSYRASFTNLAESPEKSFEMYRQFNMLLVYTRNSTATPLESINAIYSIPIILKEGGIEGASKIIWLLMLSIYFAGLTTIIPLMEIGSHAASEIMQLGRKRGIFAISLLSMLLVALMYIQPIKAVILGVPFSIILIMAAMEALPIITSRRVFDESVRGLVEILFGLFLLLGLFGLYFAFIKGTLYVKLGAVIGLILLIPIAFNNLLLKPKG
ncbi:hypothetical protein PAP_01650 [Palaeococcus pacificus DY20341]|uniref:Uncharacterized protein n=1 Tax=Palaeococcus pacificus DY20341 TaxID=1343739 RepID=A0A075LR26_9EURY|nr:sodium-dependent transporter [Palaeococcus pacificus]AIF68769.1 hypothetical protein PAP_01650 [Palaeococcus pacificus DY20341]